MPTINPRVNMTLEPSLAAILSELARKERATVSGFAKKLLTEALERYEDQALSEIAQKIDIPNAKRVNHKKVWANFLDN